MPIWGKTSIYYFKRQGNVAQNIAHVSPDEIGISTIVLFELQVGIAKSNSPAKRKQRFHFKELLLLTILRSFREFQDWRSRIGIKLNTTQLQKLGLLRKWLRSHKK